MPSLTPVTPGSATITAVVAPLAGVFCSVFLPCSEGLACSDHSGPRLNAVSSSVLTLTPVSA